MYRRLTEYTRFGTLIVKGCRTVFSQKPRSSAFLSNAIFRLAEYEDIGLSPDEVRKLKEIDKKSQDGFSDEQLNECYKCIHWNYGSGCTVPNVKWYCKLQADIV